MPGKYCCVREPYLKSTTFFGIPKDDERKKKWEDALGMTFKKIHFVCATHFK